MEKLKYIEPTMTIERFSFRDIIVTSTPLEKDEHDQFGDNPGDIGNPPEGGGNGGDFNTP